MVTSALQDDRSVIIEQHLVLRELTLRPSGEWTPCHQEWFIVRVAEGTAYWLQPGAAVRQLGAGDGLMTVGGVNGVNGVLRASQLGELKLHFFVIHPQYLNGLLTVAEWHRLEAAPDGASPPAVIFTADTILAQKFKRLVEQPRREGLPARCSLLQLWASAIADLLPAPMPEPAGNGKLRERFRRLMDRLPATELCSRPLSDLAGRLNCSERHFRRLFCEEFGLSLRARQIELRLQHACQLLMESDANIVNIAIESGYSHRGLFNRMFKKRFGLTPSRWRQKWKARFLADGQVIGTSAIRAH